MFKYLLLSWVFKQLSFLSTKIKLAILLAYLTAKQELQNCLNPMFKHKLDCKITRQKIMFAMFRTILINFRFKIGTISLEKQIVKFLELNKWWLLKICFYLVLVSFSKKQPPTEYLRRLQIFIVVSVYLLVESTESLPWRHNIKIKSKTSNIRV